MDFSLFEPHGGAFDLLLSHRRLIQSFLRLMKTGWCDTV